MWKNTCRENIGIYVTCTLGLRIKRELSDHLITHLFVLSRFSGLIAQSSPVRVKRASLQGPSSHASAPSTGCIDSAEGICNLSKKLKYTYIAKQLFLLAGDLSMMKKHRRGQVVVSGFIHFVGAGASLGAYQAFPHCKSGSLSSNR